MDIRDYNWGYFQLTLKILRADPNDAQQVTSCKSVDQKLLEKMVCVIDKDNLTQKCIFCRPQA